MRTRLRRRSHVSLSQPPASSGRNGRARVLTGAILASSMAFLDGAVLSIAIPALRADLSATLAEAQWVSNAYALFLGALILIGGAAGDVYGVRRVFRLGIAGFVVASLACALAPTAGLLVAARGLQGVAAALMIPGSLALIAQTYSRAERGGAIGLWAAASSAMTILGPVVGGFLLTGFGDWAWRLVFAINLPLGIVALVLLAGPDRPSAAARRRLDLPGAVLASLGLGALAYALTGSGEGAPPLSHMALFGAVGLAVLAGFVFWQVRTPTPMMPLRLFAIPAFAGANLVTLFVYGALAGVLFFLPMTLIGGWGASPADVALVLLPFGGVLTLVSPLAGRWSDRFGAWPLLAAGSALVAVVFFGLGATAPHEALWTLVPVFMALLGLGMGLIASPLSTAVMASVEDGDAGTASGINNAVSRVAGLMAVAAFGLIVTQVFERGLGGLAEQALFFGLAPESELTSEQERLRHAATNAAFAAVAYGCALLSALSAATAALMTLRR
jgi:EmrB/QacA subfamily drug resistance transporter